jgi:transposase
VDFPDGRRLVPVLVVTWSDSNAPLALALPTERTEAVLYGLVAAFEFFGGVPGRCGGTTPRPSPPTSSAGASGHSTRGTPRSPRIPPSPPRSAYPPPRRRSPGSRIG